MIELTIPFIVVQIDGDCGLKCMKPRLEALPRELD